MNAQSDPWGGIAVVECAHVSRYKTKSQTQLTVLLLFDFAAFVRVALLRVLAVLDNFAVLPCFFLYFLHFSALILEPNLRTPVFSSRHFNSYRLSIKSVKYHLISLTCTILTLRPVSLARVSRTFLQGFGLSSKEALNARRC